MTVGRSVPTVTVLVELRPGEDGRLHAHVRGLDPVIDCGEVGLTDLPLLLEALVEQQRQG